MDSPVASTSGSVSPGETIPPQPPLLTGGSPPPVPRPGAFTAYTTRLFPISGFSACSASRVTAGLRMMSQTSSR